MTEQEVSVRLTENDERLYACAKRLEAGNADRTLWINW